MANSVTFPEALGGNGQTYTDDADPVTGLDGLGYTVRFIPCLQQAVAMGLSAQSNAEAAAGYVEQCQTLRQEVATDRQAVAGDRVHIDQQKTAVDTAAGQVATDKQAVAGDRAHIDQQKTDVDTAAGQVATDKQAVAGDRTHIDQQKTAVDTAAGQVATDRQAVSNDRLASEQAAGASSAAADASILARNQAEALYGDLTAVDAAKTEAQQAATLSGEERGLAETARTGAETAQAASEQAASTSQQAASDAVGAHEEKLDPHTQYEKKEALKAAAYREIVGPAGAPVMAQGAFGIGGTAEIIVDIDDRAYRPGFYTIDPNTIGDSPFSAGSLIIMWRGARVIQIATFESAASPDMFIRVYNSGWGTWKKHYSTSNVVGAVSQSGGEPTGAVIEKDSNSFWSWVKLASGDMTAHARIQHNNVDITVARGSLFESVQFDPPDLPSGFTSAPITVATDYYGLDDVSVWGSSAGARSGTKIFQQYRFIRPTASSGRTVMANITLKGRWY
ncbi:pyocin knob domain-containing protein [Vreelandella titanicae]|uniref:Uncharacterized protein n=1 Tax=Vreelandella titanicae TaxID=664683 RepID=A0A558J3V3_9GAMM|nr:pyocin knob domain-containing protein [Halomonas titanicae]TVU88318.1 hypothetical protein FQP89_18870 [Halomonas titanicae]